jgi:hypothetical protein
MNKIAVFAGILFAGTAAGQIADWKTLFTQLSDPDPAVNGAARKKSFEELIPRLESEDRASLAKDLTDISSAFTAAQPIRMQASGLLAGLAMRRPDGATALEPVFPLFTRLYHDSEPRIRINAVMSVAALQPRVPEELLPGLAELVHDPDFRLAGAAVAGLTRSANDSEFALGRLEQLLSSDESDKVRGSVVQAIGLTRDAPAPLIEQMRKLLDGSSQALLLETIRSLGRIGPAAAVARADLERLARTGSPDVASAANDALSRIVQR